MTIIQKQNIFILNVSKLILFVYKNGYQLTGGELYRHEGFTKYKNIDSNVKRSKHCDRLAIDLYLYSKGSLVTNKKKHKILSRYWKSLHRLNRSGYETLPNHFEMQ